MANTYEDAARMTPSNFSLFGILHHNGKFYPGNANIDARVLNEEVKRTDRVLESVGKDPSEYPTAYPVSGHDVAIARHGTSYVMSPSPDARLSLVPNLANHPNRVVDPRII